MHELVSAQVPSSRKRPNPYSALHYSNHPYLFRHRIIDVIVNETELSEISFQEHLRRNLSRGKHEPYLRHIRFPRFKNLLEGTRIDFDFPITAIVGPNGTNKSSILRAIEGAPDQQNIGNHWFTTNLDPIKAEERHRFIHGYQTPSGQIIEAIKTRVERKGNPDYWEPSRPLINPPDEMAKMPAMEDVPLEDRNLRRATRWNPIRKNVVYLDLAFYVSAFDLFYRLDAGKIPRSQNEKKKRLRERTVHLRNAINSSVGSHVYYQQERILEVAERLNEEHVKWISRILGRTYNDIKIIEHAYFDTPGHTVALRAGDLAYSEAFAGSGEYAVTFLVKKTMDAPDHSLVILDEPELSLHPTAQKELMAFLQIMCSEKYHQIVLATHSPSIVQDLPPDAIKMMTLDEDTGQATISSQETYAIDAFRRLGAKVDVPQIFVEDDLAKALVDAVLLQMGVLESVEVIVLGSSSNIRRQYIPTLARQNRDCLILLDGDERPTTEIPQVDSISRACLSQYLELLVPDKKSLGLDGGNADNLEQHQEIGYNILKWAESYLRYLPSHTPEELLIACLGEDLPEKQTPKEFWKERTRKRLSKVIPGDPSSKDILYQQRLAINEIDFEESLLTDVRAILNEYLKRR